MNITAAPDTIRWDTVREFLASLGIDLSEVPIDSPVVIGRHWIKCDLYARNADGDRYLDETTGAAARHHVLIPIVDD